MEIYKFSWVSFERINWIKDRIFAILQNIPSEHFYKIDNFTKKSIYQGYVFVKKELHYERFPVNFARIFE